MSFLGELHRRNVVRMGIAYTVTAWLLLQVTDVVMQLSLIHISEPTRPY